MIFTSCIVAASGEPNQDEIIKSVDLEIPPSSISTGF